MDYYDHEKKRRTIAHFESELNKAEDYARDPSRQRMLVYDAQRKTAALRKHKGPFDTFWGYLNDLLRLLKAYYRREYTAIAWGSIILITAALLYFVSPLDAIPDVVPGIGLLDDVFIVGWVLKQLKADIDNFREWEIGTAK